MSNLYSLTQMLLESGLGINNFHSCYCNEDNAILYGHYSIELYKICTELNHKFEWDHSVHALKATNGVLTIFLHPKP